MKSAKHIVFVSAVFCILGIQYSRVKRQSLPHFAFPCCRVLQRVVRLRAAGRSSPIHFR